MTSERAQYHLLMLRLGHCESYEQELDRILAEEDPLPPLVLDLALCMSDLNKTISILREYLLDHPADQQTVYDMVLADVHQKYGAKEWNTVQTAGFLWEVQRIVSTNYEAPWDRLYKLTQEFELFEEGLISREVFEEAFDSVFCRGIGLDVWAMEAARHPKKKKSLLDFLRRK